MPKKLTLANVSAKPARGVAPLLADVRGLILAAREGAARTVNAGLTRLYWQIGTRIRRDVLNDKLTPDLVVGGPYVLDFLGLRKVHAGVRRERRGGLQRPLNSTTLQL